LNFPDADAQARGTADEVARRSYGKLVAFLADSGRSRGPPLPAAAAIGLADVTARKTGSDVKPGDMRTFPRGFSFC
jgi:phage tail protein X